MKATQSALIGYTICVLIVCLLLVLSEHGKVVDKRVDWLRDSRLLNNGTVTWNRKKDNEGYQYWSDDDKKGEPGGGVNVAGSVNVHSLSDLPEESAICGIDAFIVNSDGSPSNGLVITFANLAYIKQGLISNLICSLSRLNITAYVIVVTDAEAYKEITKLGHASHVHWCPSYWNGTSADALRESYVSTPEYLYFIKKRTAFVGVLLTHTSILSSSIQYVTLTDGDTVWAHDALQVALSLGGSSTCDAYVVNDAEEGAAVDHHHRIEPVGGFIIYNVRRDGTTAQRFSLLFKLWTSVMSCLGSREQPALHAALMLLNVNFGRPWSKPSGSSDSLLFCVLPGYHYPTSAHLTMRSKNNANPTYKNSNYMVEFGYTNPKLVSSSVVVAHSNVKVKSGKVSWMSQFRLFFWDLLQEKCRFPGGEAMILKPHQSLPNHPDYVPSHFPSPITRARQHIGWVKPNALSPWSIDFEKYLESRAAPSEKWAACEASFAE
eukprot:TRINITY_DN17805_c0_g1_i1.p1 TRINITY_DN17805_c0_g1~~TRINITY_DN17805_c0_g1_i1.p1  ORF type:complete len:491 (+),score=58.97 TRINITY_DN17805_c0_g1_i1:50-1522(+)